MPDRTKLDLGDINILLKFNETRSFSLNFIVLTNTRSADERYCKKNPKIVFYTLYNVEVKRCHSKNLRRMY